MYKRPDLKLFSPYNDDEFDSDVHYHVVTIQLFDPTFRWGKTKLIDISMDSTNKNQPYRYIFDLFYEMKQKAKIVSGQHRCLVDPNIMNGNMLRDLEKMIDSLK